MIGRTDKMGSVSEGTRQDPESHHDRHHGRNIIIKILRVRNGRRRKVRSTKQRHSSDDKKKKKKWYNSNG